MAERIADIHELAVRGLAKAQQMLSSKSVMSDAKRTGYVHAIIEYERRLVNLASSPKATPREAERLSEDAGAFFRKTGIRDIFIEETAMKLAALLRIRCQRRQTHG